MKSYIYVALTLVSISLSHVQAAENPSIEEIVASKKRISSILTALAGGSLGAMTVSVTGTKEPLSIVTGSILGYLWGCAWTDCFNMYLNIKDTNDSMNSTAFWTSFVGIALFDYVRRTQIEVA